MRTQAHGREPGMDRADAAAEPPATGDRLSHLFRASIKNGRVHPLYLHILKYRHSRAQP